MAFDERLAERLREAVDGTRNVTEKRMFGGLALMVDGHLACGVIGNEIMVRVGPEAHAAALTRPGAREMDFTGRPMAGWIVVGPAGLKGRALAAWVGRALAFVATLPPK
jgi:TfoX/Sxy family transcriptional regulator of competence genes